MRYKKFLFFQRVVNDSMHSVTIKGLPKAASPLGALIAHDIFQVMWFEYYKGFHFCCLLLWVYAALHLKTNLMLLNEVGGSLAALKLLVMYKKAVCICVIRQELQDLTKTNFIRKPDRPTRERPMQIFNTLHPFHFISTPGTALSPTHPKRVSVYV